ncbi:MAG TPA: glycosyltransferase family 1 protein [Nitrospirota bacterium]|nr:glycosyltransferase family 1 protein [Nitrospirota bacterium]
MNIGLNLVGFIPGTMGGIETYLRNLVHSLQKIDQENSYVLLCDDHYAKEIQIFNDSFTFRSVNYTQPSILWLVRGILRKMTKIDVLRPVFNRLKLDIIHHPFTILNPMRTKIPSVLTFVDMQHEFFPQFFSPAEMKMRKEFYRPSAEQATRIIAISGHVKSSLAERYGISPDKIDVVYLGYDERYRVYNNEDVLQTTRSKYELNRPFLYYPGATWPHKNHKTLLAALNRMTERYQFDGQLVLTGIAKKSYSDIIGEIKRLGLGDKVKVLGYLPYEELPYLYNLARALVFPSLFEGFGIPLVEAMACGCPIACSNTTSIPEVVGDAGVFFDPTSPEDMADKIWQLWKDDERLKEMRKRGLERAKLFSWDETARKTIETYRKTIEGARS